jgi:hypothetical protein
MTSYSGGVIAMAHGTKQKAHTCAYASNSIYYMLQRAENEIHSYSN